MAHGVFIKSAFVYFQTMFYIALNALCNIVLKVYFKRRSVL